MPSSRPPSTPRRIPSRARRARGAGGGITRRTLLEGALGAGLAAGLSALPFQVGCARRRGERPSILLITLDTTRADRLACYNPGLRVAPSLDRLAESAVIFTRAFATSSWTLPSHGSLFTGKFPSSHGARFDPNGPIRLSSAIHDKPMWQKFRVQPLSPRERTLARILKERGYATGAVVGGPWLKKPFGLHHGFDHYDDSRIFALNGRPASDVTASALRWLSNMRGRSFFLFLNYFDPHGPYKTPCGFASGPLPDGKTPSGSISVPEARTLYDAEISCMDRSVGNLLDGLRAAGLYDRTWIIVTADHGELLGEHHFFGHGQSLWQEELRIPLLLKYPRGEVPPAREDTAVQLNDVFAMILHRLGLPLPATVQAGVPPRIGHPIVAEVNPLPDLAPGGQWRALLEGDWKYLWNSRGNNGLFDLRNDPIEARNLLGARPDQAGAMARRLDGYFALLPRPGRVGGEKRIDPETEKALKSLGYLGQ